MKMAFSVLSVRAVLSVLCLLLASTHIAPAQETDARLNTFFKHHLDETFRLRPMEATQLGDHRFDDQLDNLSPAALKGWVEHARRTLQQMPKQVDYQKLSRPAHTDFEILRQDLTKSLCLPANTNPSHKN